MPRQKSNTSGLRELVIADRQRRLDRWNANRWPNTEPMEDPLLEALKAGEAVDVGASTLMGALLSAGLPEATYRRFCYGGADYGKRFLLTERDELTEPPDDS